MTENADGIGRRKEKHWAKKKSRGYAICGSGLVYINTVKQPFYLATDKDQFLEVDR